MAKREVKKRHNESSEINKALIENFVNLQKVLTNLSAKFDKLSNNISTLLQLFEISAKSFAEKQGISTADKDREFLNKINTLLEQNKTIAKGLTLMEEKIRERVYGQATMPPVRPEFPARFPIKQEEMGEERPRTRPLPQY